MVTYEGLRLKILKYRRSVFANLLKKNLNTTDFTIISNNCWGGMIYESYNLPKQSPTVGLFFMADDYIKFISDMRGYINGNLKFIDPNKSRWREAPQVSGDKRFLTYPVGLLSNGEHTIEIFFLHYHSEKEAEEKWNKRCERINWERMLVKFNDQNGCTEKDVKTFFELPFANKLFFTCKEWLDFMGIEGYLQVKQPGHDCIMASYEPFGKTKDINISRVINSL